MPIVTPTDTSEILQLLEKDPYLHIYSIGDLDERFRPFITWYGLTANGKLSAVICIYRGGGLPAVMALNSNTETGFAYMKELISGTSALLPECFVAHLSPGLEELFADTHDFESSVPHYKMALKQFPGPESPDTGNAVRLGRENIPQMLELYRESYPGNWFDPDMLELSRYYGISVNGRLISIAGTHVFSPEYAASAAGNITTHPDYRGKGYGTKVTAALCRALVSEGLRVGLNVKKENLSAVACYRKVGFEICAEYREISLRRRNR